MTRQIFISQVVKMYLKGYKSIIFVTSEYIIYQIHLFKTMNFEYIEEVYKTFESEINSLHYRFID